jgi:4-amino-4-deoxy-L-arabinose transferase-like glycosyltransferase
MNARVSLFIIIFVDLSFLLFSISNISISYHEAEIFFDQKNFIHIIAHLSTMIFGQNDFALRLPFVLFHIGSIILLYKISTFYLKREFDRIMSVVVFVMLPGVTSAAILVNSATVSIFFTLLFLYFFLNKKENYYALLLPLLVFIDDSFLTLYLALFVYGFMKKETFIAVMSFFLILVSLYIYGFDITNDPKVYFFNVFAVYAAIFSPFIFLYFFYALYRIFIKGEKSIIWYISSVALVFSIILSFRKMILIEDFAPFVVIATPLMFAVFMRSYRIRLPELRGIHTFLFSFTFISLVLIFLLAHLNKYLYLYMDKPSKHFAYKYHIAKELADRLKGDGIDEVLINNKMQKRLKFYGIKEGDRYIVNDIRGATNSKSVTISYFNMPIKTYYVSKIHKN